MRSIFLVFLFWAVAASAVPAPIVYTGAFKNKHTGKEQIARVLLTAAPKAGQTALSYTAVVVLYFGAENSREYVGLYYDPVLARPKNRELFLSRDDDARGRRLPTIRLKFSADGSTAEGPIYSQTEGESGTLSLKLGWDHNVKDPVSELGGIYSANCAPGDGSRMFVRDIEIVPSRIFAEKAAPEGAFGVINYIGNGTCRGYQNEISCVNLSPGTYNFFKDKVTFYQGGWRWDCERDGKDSLLCQSPRYPYCHLRKDNALPMPVYSVEKRPAPVALPWVLTEPKADGDCDGWDGEFHGRLTHFLGGRQQAISVRLTSFPLADDRCLLNGTAQIYFQDQGTLGARISFPLVNTEVPSGARTLLLQSDANTDLTLQLERTDQTTISGNWISRLYGLVGTFAAKSGEKISPSTEANAVQGLAGNFVWRSQAKWTWSFSEAEAGFDKSSHDPFAQIRIIGSLVMDAVLLDKPVPLNAGNVGSASYDYFTNTLVIRTGAILSGYIEPEGVRLRGVSSGYLNIAPDYALRIPKLYLRQ